jgi:leader peptidase (prepilin peptidase)/N-methyltransferase
MLYLILIFIFIFGLFIGSFFNVLIDRLPQNKSPWKGRSKCDFCKTPLSPLDLIPVFSFLFLKGKCSYCHKKLSIQYPLIEILTGLMYLGLAVSISKLSIINFQLPINFQYSNIFSVLNLTVLLSYLSLLIIFSSLFVIFVADLKYQIIPDEMLISLIIGITLMMVIKIGEMIGGDPSLTLRMTAHHLLSALGTGVFFLMIYFGSKMIFKKEGMGFGDVKLAPILGLFLGFPKTITALYLAFLTGAFVSIILILLAKKKWKSKIAFGPFLITGAIISFFAGDIISKWYLSLFL